MSELNDKLKARVQAQYARLRDAQKRRYAYAKQLGFSASEAVILQNWRTEKIDSLAIERCFIKR